MPDSRNTQYRQNKKLKTVPGSHSENQAEMPGIKISAPRYNYRYNSGQQFVFEFKSRNSGYGNRTEQTPDQVVTDHTTVVTVIKGNVTSALLDQKWDMLKQEFLESEKTHEEEIKEIAKQFVENSSTYEFDGFDLEYNKTLYPDITNCSQCLIFVFEFKSRHAGYGNRTGQDLAEVITPHEAHITVENENVTAALMDGKWDMLGQKLTGEYEKLEGSMNVSELLKNTVYNKEVKIYGKLSLLGQLLCPCFELTSGGKTINVWHSLMLEDDRSERPSVSVEGIKNGDFVVVTGELKLAGRYRQTNDFWTKNIEKIESGGVFPAPELNNITENEDEEELNLENYLSSEEYISALEKYFEIYQTFLIMRKLKAFFY